MVKEKVSFEAWALNAKGKDHDGVSFSGIIYLYTPDEIIP